MRRAALRRAAPRRAAPRRAANAPPPAVLRCELATELSRNAGGLMGMPDDTFARVNPNPLTLNPSLPSERSE